MNFFTDLITEYGLIAMFFLMLLEYACFPISSEIVLPFSGAVASINGISFFTILTASIFAGAIGTSICYYFGNLGGTAILNKIIQKFPKTEKGITSSMEKFQRFGTPAVCIGRVIPLCRTYISFVAGALKQPYPIFLFASVIGITIWNTLLLGIGFLCRENWGLMKNYYEQYKHGIYLFFAVLLLVLVVQTYRKKR